MEVKKKGGANLLLPPKSMSPLKKNLSVKRIKKANAVEVPKGP